MQRMRCLALMLGLAAAGAAWAGPYEDGVAAFTRGDYQRAFALFKPLADAGDARAQVRLGIMYFNGQGVAEDEGEALRWFRSAAEAGDADGAFRLGYLYAYGYAEPEEGTAQEAAARWYRRAAEQGHADAAFQLGLLYLTGSGIDKDPEEGMRWIRRAAEAGLKEARDFVGDYR
ncbi:tetratricopeptide repeat protein [Inmirania thermothiophila]|uniref:Sel1 repeat-containing protein n=1 Tax=Inmirania thermothiophila TaxID=1750597 RepID=A0A3N1YB46_9GAMM|nr:tetratricopeptide repeat protein [Inmirania thermothiophila]ROR34617.1 hypothetical protein EDC57_0516 [Inmirania thermothiophila]